ncbi:MAG: flavodoxin [Treponema sp.]|nr:flavodoxin [Treponema sp.]MCL2237754.1 flavodoxin [Treponema sp.]
MKKPIFMFILILLFLSACNSSRTETKTAASTTAQEELNMNNSSDSPKILVAYFSCTGNTGAVAAHIAGELNTKTAIADLHEIKPEVPYTSNDLNWRDNSSRASKENADTSSRPSISGSVLNIENYDIIFIGYPIWWGQAPKIVYTFMESYDFSGKTIVPFCTSGSSGIGSSAVNLQKVCSSSAVWLPGFRFAANASQSSIQTWLNEVDLSIVAK